MLGVVGAGGSYSVTNKTGGPQLPAATGHGGNARHSKLKSLGGGGQGSGTPAGHLQQIGQGSAKMAKKQSGRDSTLPGGIPGDNSNKDVKPSELSLDLIIPTSIRGAKQSPMSGAQAT